MVKKRLFSIAVAGLVAITSVQTFSMDVYAVESNQPIKKNVVKALSKKDIQILKSIFDAEFYARQNPDVVRLIGKSPSVLFSHFCQCGLWEGRMINPDFNPDAYASAYQDLTYLFGNDVMKYYRHYINFGKSEKRTLTTIEKCSDAGILVYSVSDFKTGVKGVISGAIPKNKNALSTKTNKLYEVSEQYSDNNVTIVEQNDSHSVNESMDNRVASTTAPVILLGSLSYVDKNGVSHTLSWNDLLNNAKEAEAASGDYTKPYIKVENGKIIAAGNIANADIVLNDKITEVSPDVFAGKSLNSLVVNGATSIPAEAFKDSNINSLTMGAGVQIAGNAFSGAHISTMELGGDIAYANNSLSGLTIDKLIADSDTDFLGKAAIIWQGSAIKQMTIKDGVTYIKANQFKNLPIEELLLPSSVVSLGENAFEKCNLMKKLTIEGEVTSIPNRCFVDCVSLKNIYLPVTISSIGREAFGRYKNNSPYEISLEKIFFAGSSAQWEELVKNIDMGHVGDERSSYTNNEALIYAPVVSCEDGDITFSTTEGGGVDIDGDGVIDISWDTMLKNAPDEPYYVEVKGNTVTKIRNMGNTGVKLYIPSGIVAIGGSEVQSVSGTTLLGDGDDKGSGSYTIYIPKSVKKINYYAFSVRDPNYYTTPIIKFEYEERTSTDDDLEIDWYAFKRNANINDETFNVPIGVTSIGGYAFMGTEITKFTLPDTVTSIGEGAFSYCTKLVEVNIPTSVISIGDYAFRDCYSYEWVDGDQIYFGLNEVYIPNSVESIGKGAFKVCRNLERVYIPASVTSMGADLFRSVNSTYNDKVKVYFGGTAEQWKERVGTNAYVGLGENAKIYVNCNGFDDTHEEYIDPSVIPVGAALLSFTPNVEAEENSMLNETENGEEADKKEEVEDIKKDDEDDAGKIGEEVGEPANEADSSEESATEEVEVNE